MTDLAFTGPSHLSRLEEAWCRASLRDLRRHEGLVTWRSGGAYGLDTLVVEESGVNQDIKLIYPADQHFNRALLEEWDFTEAIAVPGSYRDRNEVLVRGAFALHAYLRSATFYRSGEWMTVNIARRLHVPTEFHVIPPRFR